ncbi:CHAT domain-containing protein [Nordella sp. HKS 07]|uniref:CHAT domain-containing protein n=1 Tax=Nordella sp. HKS 07 TaxID=2712222 RepID=UPI0013E15EC4|nr:CHAT domain-containing protein [Nordella sp. HKS 07]QIG52126.1 CHAT domain-containing protein [Nordella sp. HKS 07]
MLMFGQQAGLTVADPEGEYVAVELRLFPADEQGTPVELTVSGVRQDFPRVRVPLASKELSALVTSPHAYGEMLGKQLFEGTQLGEQLADLRTALDAKGARWRLRLRLEDPPLEAMHWERLCIRENGAWAPIGSAADRPFSRYVPVTDWKMATPIVERPVTLLLVFASPANLAKARLPAIPAAERDSIRAAIEASARGQVRVEELSSDVNVRPTLAALREAFTRGPAMVHVLCHGTSGPAGSALVLEKDNGDPDIIEAALLVDAVRGAAMPPRLVVFSACESATASAAAGFVSLGSLLARERVDAVLAMREAVSVDTARAFCAHFYRRLFAHGVLDRAVNEARAVVRDNIDWGLPVLFARMRDCQLLDFAPARVDTDYLGISSRVVRAAGAARAFGEQERAGQEAIGAMTALIAELEKSHKVLVGVTSGFRRTGSDPATFPKQFEAFLQEFKDYYDKKSWREERTRCGRVKDLTEPAMMNLFKGALPNDQFAQVEQDLNRLTHLDDDIIRHLTTFLETMDGEVETINKLLRQGNVPDAIARKIAFEDQISPTFRRSKELLAEIGERSDAVRAA